MHACMRRHACPQWFAPYDPRAEVGPSLLPPGVPPAEYVLVARAGEGITTLKDVARRSNSLGFVVGSPASQALREALGELQEGAEAAGEDVRYQPRYRRYETLGGGIAGAWPRARCDGLRSANRRRVEPMSAQVPRQSRVGRADARRIIV